MVEHRPDHQPIHLDVDPDVARHPELLRGIWQAPRGPITRLCAWVILAMIALGVGIMVWAIIRF